MLSICNVNGHRNPRDVTDKSSCRRQNLDQNQEENNRNNHMDCATCFMDSTSNLHTVLMENIKAQGDLRIFFFFFTNRKAGEHQNKSSKSGQSDSRPGPLLAPRMHGGPRVETTYRWRCGPS